MSKSTAIPREFCCETGKITFLDWLKSEDGGVPVRVARLAAGANRLANLNAGLYLVKIGAAPAVPVRVR